MTDRKITCSACKSAMTKADIESTDLEFDGELKATNQPEYTAEADTDLVATVGTLDEYSPMVRTSGNQTIAGAKTFTNATVFSANPKVISAMGGSYTKQVTDFTHNARPERNTTLRFIQLNDSEDNYIGRINISVDSNGNTRLRFEGYVIDGEGNRVVKNADIATLTP